jgi:hypothetical protein
MVSLLPMIGHCQLCGEEEVDLTLAVHSPFNMSYNNDVTKKKARNKPSQQRQSCERCTWQEEMR